ncbi:MAG: hypothetical protein JSS43_23965 [Proteobacteria bacterium]|nr:hypothetical protein [Pseudomonadota bacterium]
MFVESTKAVRSMRFVLVVLGFFIIGPFNCAMAQMPNGCANIGRSVQSNQQITITFKNSTREPLNVFWVNFTGGLQSYKQLAPKQQYVQPTYRGHTWIIKDASGMCVRALTASTSGLVEISSNIQLEIMASPAGFAQGPSLGHAFMCIEMLLNQGIKEDCFGFYPKNGGTELAVGGPGVVNNEFDKNPVRFSNIIASGKWPLSINLRASILAAINNYDTGHYALTDANCIDFIDAIARIAGLKTPSRSPLQTPAKYVQGLVQMNPN